MARTQRIAVVTGASSGLGESIAISLADQNFHVILASRNYLALEVVQKGIVQNGGKSTIVETDVTMESSVDHLTREAGKIGFVDVVVNNSGTGSFADITDHTTEDFDRQINVNLRGAFLVSRGFIRAMKREKRGTLVFINSVAGKWGYPNSAGYVASKFGLRGLADSLRNELRPDHIKVISVFPGAIDSPFWESIQGEFPRKEMMNRESVADSVVTAITCPGDSVIEEIVIRRVQGDF